MLMLMLLLALIPRNNSSDYWKKYSFNSAGILVNGHLVYPWTDVRGLSFSMRVDRRDQNVAETWSLRTISSVPSRNGRLVPIYRTFNYGALEVFSHLSTKPSLVVKCPRSFSTATRLFRKMKEFSNETNPNINFRILSSLDKKDRMVEETTRT